ncbi:MAG: 5-bromo-4-chloroindolyl phosphate hydrolysis family protein [Blautia sp.]|nr:5-bromo-4-chloroindolyl phosphate hydrolysis family protein [Blautia sp.]
MGREKDWEELGDEIAHAVNHAVSDKNYAALNETINKIIDHAVDSGGDALKNVLGGGRHDRERARRERMRREAPPYMEQPRYAYGEQYRNAHPAPPVKQKKKAEPGSFVGPGILSVVGAGLLVDAVQTLFADGLLGLFDGGNIIGGGILAVVGGMLFWKGASKLLKLYHFKVYTDVLAEKAYGDIGEMARRIHKDKAYVVKELKEMVAEGYFPEGYVDADGTTFMISEALYKEYVALSAERARYQQSQEEERRRQEQEQRQRAAAAPTKEAAPSEQVDPRVKEILQKGEQYLAKLRECNEAIPGEAISAKISRMEELVHKILLRAKAHPEVGGELKKMMNYYLPTTVKLLEAYQEMDGQPVAGENISSAKREIEETLDTLNMAFERLLDSIFQDTAWDVSSDISVLQTMLAQEGLAGNDFGSFAAGAGQAAAMKKE